ncbi:MAG: isoleucine--tRNA ligase [Candidatus Midichloria mitochondrii]
MKLEKIYPHLEVGNSLAQAEEEIISRWQSLKIFAKSIKGDTDYIFYDGPPFANGLPHYGHLLTGFIKDTFARYHTMLGQRVERRFGWDCHGLPAEMAAEKELGVSGKNEIENFGIGNFNEYCRTSVLKHTKEWQHYVNRQARWVDFTNDYKTMDKNYMESVIWAFKELYKKGLIYESMRVMPYSWACQTPVSDFETRIDNAYREKQSKAVTVAVKLKDKIQDLPNLPTYCLIWTTTPWTLPSNLAIAVNKDIEYSAILKDDKIYIIASALLHKYKNEIGENIVKPIKGSDLLNKTYHPIFNYFADHKNAFVILHGDFVTTEDGTGMVHVAPGFGEDDFNLCQQHAIEIVCPVDNAGKFVFPVTDYIGKQVFEANDDIIIYLKRQNLWLKTEQYIHNYPHCWRTDTPLIYKAIPSWYIRVTEIREQMLKNNQQINWIPSHIKDGLFGKWLENARDWLISRNRYWGCPIPVWRSDDPEYPYIEVYGSIGELEEAFNVKIEDLHRPFIDTLTKKNPKDPTGKSTLRRVADVLDCWFESGSMPHAQQHYPFENKEKFENNFPADFIVEYAAQTRGWFYTLMVLSTALFDKPPFLNCICHGVILGEGGQKLSKRLKNYADPNEVFETIGADPLRWFMLSSGVMRGSELTIDKEAKVIKEVFRLVIKPILNSYNFFSMYANADRIEACFDLSSKNFMDQYIISKCLKTINIVKKAMDSYDTVTATKASESFFEILTNWYIRRSRERFWKSEIGEDKLAAYNTLFSALVLISNAIAPLLPLTTESIFLRLYNANVSEDTSIHLEKYPEVDISLIKEDLIESMDRVMDACNAVLYLRNDLGIRVRQPLAKVTFIGVAEDLSDDMSKLILDEINVKSWESLPKSEITKYANLKIKLNLQIIGKRIPTYVKQLIAASKADNWHIQDNKAILDGIELLPEEFSITLEPKPEYKNVASSLTTNDALIVLDTEITDSLKREGIARDIVRIIQQARKDKNFSITDRIKISLTTKDELIATALDEWQDYIESQTLGKFSKDLEDFSPGEEFDLEDGKVTLQIVYI